MTTPQWQLSNLAYNQYFHNPGFEYIQILVYWCDEFVNKPQASKLSRRNFTYCFLKEFKEFGTEMEEERLFHKQPPE